LVAPHGTATRPTSDRVRESVFNVLYSLGDPIAGATVADLYAGTGAYGLEALSRGAERAIFVEQHRDALAALNANVAALGFAAAATIVRADVGQPVAQAPVVDVAFVDPPYDFEGWPDLLIRLRSRFVVAETSRSITIPEGWELVKERVYGATVVHVLRSDTSVE
jgi:16S rRNA (guanine966-N2)-methyltransferase